MSYSLRKTLNTSLVIGGASLFLYGGFTNRPRAPPIVLEFLKHENLAGDSTYHRLAAEKIYNTTEFKTNFATYNRECKEADDAGDPLVLLGASLLLVGFARELRATPKESLDAKVRGPTR